MAASHANLTPEPMGKREKTALELLDACVARDGGSRREPQRQMCSAVASTLGQERCELIQAGTGTGKSLAYLAPLLSHLSGSEDRAVLSTATIALQRQLVQKDIPLALETLSAADQPPVSVALLKGFSNYVCRQKLLPPEDQGLLSLLEPSGLEEKPAKRSSGASHIGQEVLYVRSWAAESEDGDRDSLPEAVSDRAWRSVSLSASECPGDTCPFYDDCFARRARKTALSAQLVVTNHAILGVYCAGAEDLLGQFDALIVDEGHELPKVVREQSVCELTSRQALSVVNALGAKLHLSIIEAQEAVSALALAIEELSDGSFEALPALLAGALTQLDGALTALSGQVENLETTDDETKSARRILRTYLDELLLSVRMMLQFDPLKQAFWCETENRGQAILKIGRIDVGALIRSSLLAKRSTVITSATLKTGRNFNFFAADCGLTPEQADPHWGSLEVDSPFDYGRQGILYVATDLPRPGREGISPQAFARLGELVEASAGGMLGLFSSRSMAQAAAEYLRGETDYPVFLQGEAALSQLIGKFSADPRACLVGTLSLWQGVDVPGLTSRLVVVDRIPFPRPTEPFTLARTRALQARGENAFMQVSLTHAALLLAQGVGRLIRRVDDRGVVAVLDPRLLTAHYGTYLRQSLPPLWLTSHAHHPVSALRRLSSNLELEAL